MANYIVPKKTLHSFLPAKTELDFYKNETYVSLVGFMFRDTKIRGFGVPFHINFEEVNLRFYVKHNDKGTWKRGTVFIKEIVPRFAISFLANNLYREKYSTMKMRHAHVEKEEIITTSYEWKYKNQWNKIAAESLKPSAALISGSEEEFISEHYWGYTKYNEIKTFEYEVSHPRWDIFKVKNYTIDCDFKGLYGNEFSFLHEMKPSSVFMAKGSAIKIHHKKVIL